MFILGNDPTQIWDRTLGLLELHEDFMGPPLCPDEVEVVGAQHTVGSAEDTWGQLQQGWSIVWEDKEPDKPTTFSVLHKEGRS